MQTGQEKYNRTGHSLKYGEISEQEEITNNAEKQMDCSLCLYNCKGHRCVWPGREDMCLYMFRMACILFQAPGSKYQI
ncbi:hypothetical protein MHYP_G00200820 [Metynnis hypsauchen]